VRSWDSDLRWLTGRACEREIWEATSQHRHENIEERHTSNETEISHGRVSWQARWTYFAMGPLASSIG